MSNEAKKLAPTPAAALPKPRKRRSRRVVLAIVIILAAMGSAASAWLAMQRGYADQAVHPVQESNAPKYIAHLEGFTVNLADPEETHFLRVTMDLGFDRLPDGVSKEKISASMPMARIRDSILKILTVCKAGVLLSAEGKAQLKKSLVESLSKDVPELGVREIYFTEFLVQR